MKKIILTGLMMLLVASSWGSGEVFKYYQGNPTGYTRVGIGHAFGITIDQSGLSRVTKIKVNVERYVPYNDPKSTIALFDNSNPDPRRTNYLVLNNKITSPGGWKEFNVNWPIPSTKFHIALTRQVSAKSLYLNLRHESREPYSRKSFDALYSWHNPYWKLRSFNYNLNKDWYIEVWVNTYTRISSTSLGRVKALYH